MQVAAIVPICVKGLILGRRPGLTIESLNSLRSSENLSQGSRIVVHHGNGSPSFFDHTNGFARSSSNDNVEGIPEAFLAIAQQFGTTVFLSSIVCQDPGFDHVSHGERILKGVSRTRKTSHVDVILNSSEIDGKKRFLSGLEASFRQSFVQGCLTSLKEWMRKFESRPGFLTFVTFSACFSFGRTDPSSYSAEFLDGARVVLEIVEFDKGDGLSPCIV